MLTYKQKACLDYLTDYIARTGGISPTFEEIGASLSVRSKAGISRMLASLEERGHIHRLPNRARSITVVPKPRRERYFMWNSETKELEPWQRPK